MTDTPPGTTPIAAATTIKPTIAVPARASFVLGNTIADYLALLSAAAVVLETMTLSITINGGNQDREAVALIVNESLRTEVIRADLEEAIKWAKDAPVKDARKGAQWWADRWKEQAEAFAANTKGPPPVLWPIHPYTVAPDNGPDK